MLMDNQTRWTDDRIGALVTPQFILEQFQPERQAQLKRATSSPATPANATYLDCIFDRAKRLFLILQHIGVPEHIFALIDGSYHDDELPISSEAVRDLRLPSHPSASLDSKFYRAQFIYLVRDIREGDHKRFLDDETVPVKPVTSSTSLHLTGKDPVEKVHLVPSFSRVYGRKKISLDKPPNHLTEAEIRAEIAAARELANEHVLSVYGSYTYKHQVYVLLRPAIETTLNTFIDSPPRHFESLSKPQRREILLNWPHCLAHGLAWLHAHGAPHGAIRPSNIIIDRDYRIFLGQVEGLTITQGACKVSDLESYQYAAPERWQRAATMQKKAPPSLALHSGGRTAHKPSIYRSTPPASIHDDHSDQNSLSGPMSPNLSQPTSTSYNFLPTSKAVSSRMSHKRPGSSDYAGSVRSSTSNETAARRPGSITSFSAHPSQANSGRQTRPPPAPSSQSSQGQQKAGQAKLNSITLAPSEVRTTVVQTWQSAQFDPQAADIFSLGAIVVDIMTFLGKRSAAAFAKHRSAKNRTGGRGGGVLDASYHANLGQVCAWTISLEEDANKKAAKENLKIFEAVGPSLEVARQCLARSPNERPAVRSVERSLERSIQECTTYAMAHCQFRSPARNDVAVPSTSFDRTTSSALDKETDVRANHYEPLRSSEVARNAKSRTHDGKRASRPNSSLGRFDFGYADPEAAARQPPMTLGGLSEEEIISLQSIADRPDRSGHDDEVGNWNHHPADSRAAYPPPSKSPPASGSEEEDAYPKHGSVRARQSHSSIRASATAQYQALRNPSAHSLNQSYPSNTAAKRVNPNVTRSRGKDSGLGGIPSPGDVIEMEKMAEGGKGGPQRASTGQQRYGMVGADDVAYDAKTGKAARSTESEVEGGEISRGRNSVSTLASNSSTIRLSWQPRDVSPVSVHDPDGSTRTSLTATPAFARADASTRRLAKASDARDSGGDFKKMVGLARMERLYRNVKRNEVTIKGPMGPDEKGKEREESGPPVRKGGLASRYSILGGRM